MPLVVIQIAKTTDRLEFMDKLARTEITNKIGIPMMARSFELTDKDLKDYTAQMEKTKKPAECYIEFEGTDFSYGIRIGSKKNETTSFKLTVGGYKIPDLEKTRDILINRGVATKKQIEALRERNL